MSLFYRRVFNAKRHVRILATVILFIDVGWWISSTIIEITFPATYPETYPGNPGVRSITANYLTWWLAAGIIEVVTIIVIILIPIGELIRLQMDWRKKLLLGVTFSVSLLCVATGIARLATLYRPGATHFDGSIGDVWINTHLGSAIMSANLPICWPVVSHRKRIMSYLTSRRSSAPEDSKSRGSSRATFESRPSNVGMEKAQTGATVASTARKDSGSRGTIAARETDSIDSDWDARDLEDNRDNSVGSAREIEYRSLVSPGATGRDGVERPANAYLAS